MSQARLLVLGSKASVPTHCLKKLEQVAGPITWLSTLAAANRNTLASASLVLVEATLIDPESHNFQGICKDSDTLVVVYQCDRVKQAVQVMKLGASQALPGNLCSSQIEQILLKYLPSQSSATIV